MTDRNRGDDRDFSRDRGGRWGGDVRGGPGGAGGPGGRDRPRPAGPREGSSFRDGYRDGGQRDFRRSGAPPPYQERRPPEPPAEASDFEDVDSELALAILDTATRLTELVGTAGLPETPAERRQAVIDNFEAIYGALVESITGGEEDEAAE